MEERWNAEMVFSNHAWVRLLNLGSFHRSTPSSASPAPTASLVSDPRATDNRAVDEDRSGTSNQPTPSSTQSSRDMSSTLSSTPSMPSTNSDEASATSRRPSSATPATPGTLTPAGAILQVEDLDRMESEFLTFLNGDLATMSHDLETSE
ncbi:hypothetical protein BG006_005786 [Podila minutissima]|uniref:Uncharacterized protein n=1 Tax=Podila minutissima TaxID=64525 RepID=A0A9P5VLI5_9FUNG|nr:hypothetical protein BG006_005786 [Podila minutissima]